MSVVVPLHPEHEAAWRQAAERVYALYEAVAKGSVAVLSIRGVDVAGEVVQYDIVPVNYETLRYMMAGQLTEAAQRWAAPPDE